MSRTGIRPWNYKQSFRNLCKMLIRWNHQYDIQTVIEITKQHGKNPNIIKNMREIVNRIEEELRANP